MGISMPNRSHKHTKTLNKTYDESHWTTPPVISLTSWANWPREPARQPPPLTHLAGPSECAERLNEDSFELQPSKLQKHSFHRMLPSNYSRQNVKNTAFVLGVLRITADKTSKTQCLPHASFELQPTKLQKHSFRLRRPSNYSRQYVKTIAIARGFLRITADKTSKTQLSSEASF